MSQVVTVELGAQSYPIKIAKGNLRTLGLELAAFSLHGPLVIVTDEKVAGLYRDQVELSLNDAGIEAAWIVIPPGEQYKNLETLESITREMIKAGCNRHSLLVALGGGVVGDLAGFAASVFMRGIPFVQVPTTLLAQVDSSVGGKTGVNLPEGKNLVGSFYQPRLVLIDPEVLNTLPEREILTGVAEIIKYGVIKSVALFEKLAAVAQGNKQISEKIIAECCRIKAEVVSQDEKEGGLRMILNFGHTIGHAIETLTDYQHYTHGEAVGLGMLQETAIAVKRGKCSSAVYDKIDQVMRFWGLPVEQPDLASAQILDVVRADKKNQSANITMILPRSIGDVEIVRDLDEEELL